MIAERDKAILLVVALGSIFLIGAQANVVRKSYAYTAFIDPTAVAYIADSMPDDEGDFIIGSWDWVARNITYDNFGTIMYFSGDGIDCDTCLLPHAVIAAGGSNCVGKAALLTSILRNRLPPDSVYMVVGRLKLNGTGGHAWVRAQHNGVWYTLESTIMPPAQPWVPEDSMSWKYSPDGYVNDVTFSCFEPGLCVAIEATSCVHG